MNKKAIKKSYSQFGKNLTDTIKFSGILTIILFVVYLIFIVVFGYLLQFTSSFIVRIIALLICVSVAISIAEPFIYSFYACNGGLNTKQKDDINLGTFFRTYRIGNKPPFRGQLSIWSSLLLSFLIYLGVNVLGAAIVAIIANTTSGELHEFYLEISTLNYSSSTYVDDLYELFYGAKYAGLVETIQIYLGFFSLFFAGYFFLNRTGRFTFKYYIAQLLSNMNPRMSKRIYKLGMTGHKGDYLGNYYICSLPSTASYLILMPLVYFVAYFAFSLRNATVLSMTSLFVSTSIIALFLPLTLNYHFNIWTKYSNYFIETVIGVMTSELDELKSNTTNGLYFNLPIDENQIKEMEQFIEEAKAQYEEKKQKDKENDENEEKDENLKNSWVLRGFSKINCIIYLLKFEFIM